MIDEQCKEQKFIKKYYCTDSSAEYCNNNCDFCEKEFRKELEIIKKRIRADAIKDCILIIDKIMPAQPFLLKSKHYENWKMKTTELRMLRDIFEKMQKGAEQWTLMK